MGAAIARNGGLLVVANNPSSGNVPAILQGLKLQPDQVWIARPNHKAARTPWLLIVVFVVLGLAGAVLLVVARSRGRSPEPAVTAATG